MLSFLLLIQNVQGKSQNIPEAFFQNLQFFQNNRNDLSKNFPYAKNLKSRSPLKPIWADSLIFHSFFKIKKCLEYLNLWFDFKTIFPEHFFRKKPEFLLPHTIVTFLMPLWIDQWPWDDEACLNSWSFMLLWISCSDFDCCVAQSYIFTNFCPLKSFCKIHISCECISLNMAAVLHIATFLLIKSVICTIFSRN